MNIDAIKELQSNFATESMGSDYEVEVVDKYRNNPLGALFHDLDAIEAQAYAMESFKETVRGNLCFYQDLAVAEAAGEIAAEEISENFSIESIVEEKTSQYKKSLKDGSIHQFYSTESIVNKVKRAGYNAKIHGKEFIQKLLTWVKSIYDAYTVEDAKFKSYAKLLKSYREKLNMSTPSTKEDVEIKIRKTDYKKVVKEFMDAVPTDLSSNISSIKSSTTHEDLVNAIVAGIGAIIENAPEKISSAVKVDGTADAIQELVKEKTMVEAFKEYINELKEDGEVEEMSPSKAQSNLSTAASAVEALLVDKKYKKTVDNFIKAANTTLAKINKNKETAVNEENSAASQKVAAIGALVTQYRTGVLGPWTKFTKSSIQALLADMAKVINANTKIKGN